MPIPEFVVEMRQLIGQREMWLPAVTAVVTRGSGADEELLLVRRSDNGDWTPITGILDPREEPAAAAAREALEETGLVVEVGRVVDVYPGGGTVGKGGASFFLAFEAEVVGGVLAAADDALDARFFAPDELPELAFPSTTEAAARVRGS